VAADILPDQKGFDNLTEQHNIGKWNVTIRLQNSVVIVWNGACLMKFYVEFYVMLKSIVSPKTCWINSSSDPNM
jgi:hypothetical protein